MSEQPIRWTTQSKPNPDLDGHMFIDGDRVISYHSDRLGDAVVLDSHIGGQDLKLKVEFQDTVKEKYEVRASKTDDHEYHGKASKDFADLVEEDWTATDQG